MTITFDEFARRSPTYSELLRLACKGELAFICCLSAAELKKLSLLTKLMDSDDDLALLYEIACSCPPGGTGPNNTRAPVVPGSQCADGLIASLCSDTGQSIITIARTSLAAAIAINPDPTSKAALLAVSATLEVIDSVCETGERGAIMHDAIASICTTYRNWNATVSNMPLALQAVASGVSALFSNLTIVGIAIRRCCEEASGADRFVDRRTQRSMR